MIKVDEKRMSPPTRMAKSVRGLLGDMLTLGELQIQLFKVDLRNGKTHVIRGIILLAAGMTLLLASLPVAMIALGYGLVTLFELPMWAGLLISGATGFVIGGAVLWSASRWLSRSLEFFQRSTGELTNNVQWLKSVVSNDSPAEESENRFFNPNN